MYAIVQQGGHQFRVSPGDRLLVDRLVAEVGSVVALEPVLLVHDGTEATIGSPIVEGTRVAATVVSHPRGRKIRVFKYKAKKRYRRTQGHRSELTELRVVAVVAAGEPLPEPASPAERPARARLVTTVTAAVPARRTTRRGRDVAATPATDSAAVVKPEAEVEPDAAIETEAKAAADAVSTTSATVPARPRRRTKAVIAAEEAGAEVAGNDDAAQAPEHDASDQE